VPLTIVIPGKDFYDQKTNRFITIKTQKLSLEHSLLSISKWEARWHKPYLSRDEKSEEENLDYIRCMCLTEPSDPNVFLGLTRQNVKDIADYISNPMTATTFNNRDKKPSREIITSELIYFWMANFRIPFDPCQKWHLNRLMTLIEIASIKNQPAKKMSTRDILKQNSALNAARRAKYGSRG
jgi:hypothetical protein